jgi:hypothetical protein
MKHKPLPVITAIALAFQALTHALPAAATGGSNIAFAPDGKVSSLILETGGHNQLNPADPGRGFYLKTWSPDGPKEFRLTHIQRQGDTLIVSKGAALPRFTFAITTAQRYLALKLQRVEGLPKNAVTLHLEIRCSANVVMQGLDYMLNSKSSGLLINANWKHLWNRNSNDPLGGIAIYPAGQPDKEDSALLDVWVNEDLPKPAVKEPWTRERATQWLNDFEKLYEDQTMMLIGAASLQELYAVTDQARSAGVKQIYLHTDTWRGEYWPKQHSHIHINPKVFPKGLEDLKAYTAYLRKFGMFLTLHYTAGGIGPSDPQRIAGHVSRQLTSWGKGTLESPVDSKAQTLQFRPSPGTDFPFVSDFGLRSNIYHIFNPNFIRVGDEIIQVGAFENTDHDVWTLNGCVRGHGATEAAAHQKGEEAAGLVSGYGQNFTPDVDSPLFEEMAKEYADFANAIGLGRLEYDALEINYCPPWGGPKYTERVARHLDHPVITGSSGGTPVWGNVEVMFHRYKHLSAPGGAGASFIMETGDRRATTELEFNTSIASAVANGANKIIFQKSQAMFGINQAMLAGHGLSEKFIEAVGLWRSVALFATPEQRQALRQSMTATPIAKNSLISPVHSDGYISGVRIKETQDAYQLIPSSILIQPTDAPWMKGVESAVVAPRQFVEPGQILQMNNPNAAQPLAWTIRVLPEVAPSTTSTQAKAPAAEQTILDNYLTGVASAKQNGTAKHPLEGAHWVWLGEDDPAVDAGDKTVYFRKTLNIPENKKLLAGSLFFTADNAMDCYVNGRRVARSGSWQQVIYQDITASLHPGINVVALATMNSGGPGGGIASVQLNFEGEDPVVIHTDTTWKASDQLVEGWKEPTTPDAAWKSAVAFGEFGIPPWSKPSVATSALVALQPKATEVQNQSHAAFTQDGDGVVVSAENMRSEDQLLESGYPFWNRAAVMPGHGLSLEVTGDGSGAVLVIQLSGGGERDYVVKLDFTGKRKIVIPTGEVSWANGYWGRRPGTERFGYSGIERISMGFGYIPAKTSPKVKVENMQLLEDRPSKLINPIVTTGTGELRVTGEIESDQYLRYTGGGQATVYDENWKQVKQLPVTLHEYLMPTGVAPLSVRVSQGAPQPWLEVQFISEGNPITIPKTKE